MKRCVLTRSKTKEYEAFFHEDIQQFKLLPPKGHKRKMTHAPDGEYEQHPKRTYMDANEATIDYEQQDNRME